MHHGPGLFRRQAVSLADHLPFALQDQVVHIAIRYSRQHRRIAPALERQTHRSRNVAFPVPGGAMAHRAVVPVNLLDRRKPFWRRLHGILALRSARGLSRIRCCRNRGRRRRSRRSRVVLALFLMLRSRDAETGKEYHSDADQSVAHNYLLAADDSCCSVTTNESQASPPSWLVTRILHPRIAQ